MSPARGRYCVGSEPVPGYVLTEFLGRGQFGDVWKAAGPGNNDVALKLIDLTAGEGNRELAALQQIKSVRAANLTPIFASWLKDAEGRICDDRSMSTATELVVAMGLGSKSLFQRLAECTREGKPGIPLDELLDYMEGAARGIDYLNEPIHDLGHGPVPIIHGDIKPHNLLIVGNAVQICDFGLARALENLRMTQTALGTCAYASAELLYGKPHRASDQYCLAVSYTELRTGALPFSETNPFQVADRHREGKLDFSKLPPGEREVIQRATALVPDERWPTCRDMVRALRRASEPEEEQPVAPPRQETRRTTKKPDIVRPHPADRPSDVHPATPSSSSVQGTLLPPSPKAAGQRSTDSSQLATRTLPFRLSSTMPAAERPSRLRRVAKVRVALVLVVGLGIGADFVFNDLGVCRGVAAPVKHFFWYRQWKRDFDNHVAEHEFSEALAMLETAPDDLVDAAARKERGEEILSAWETVVNELVAEQEFAKAFAMYGAAPDGLVSAGDKQRLREETLIAWNNLFEELRKADRPDEASAMIDEAPPWLVDTAEKERLRRLLVAVLPPIPTPLPPAWDHDAFSRFLASHDFVSALSMLDKTPEQEATAGDEILKKLEQACGDRNGWQTEDWRKLQNARAALLKRWPDRAEVGVLLCWADARLENDAEALAGWKKLKPIEQMPESVRPLGQALSLVVRCGPSIVVDDAVAVAAGLSALDAATRSGSPSIWSPDAWETARIDAIRAEVKGKLLEQIAGQLAPQKSDYATKTLEAIESLLGEKSADFERWDAIVGALTACRGNASAADVSKVLKALPAKLDATVAGEIAVALDEWVGKPRTGAPGAPSEPVGVLDTALGLFRAAWQVTPEDKNIAAALGRLWKKRIEIRVAEARPATAEEFESLKKDRSLFEKADDRSSLVDAWQAECARRLKLANDLLRDLPEPASDKLPESMTAYVHYVRACLLRDRGEGGWQDQVMAELASAFKAGNDPPQVLKVQDRLDGTVALILDAAKKQRERAKLPELLGGLFSNKDYYPLLAMVCHCASDRLNDDAQQRELGIDFALAVADNASADADDKKLARSRAAALASQSDDDLGQDAIPALYAYVRTHVPDSAAATLEPKDRQAVVDACARLFGLLLKDTEYVGVFTKKDATAIYGTVIFPVRGMADAFKRGDPATESPPALDVFYANVGRFIWNYRSAEWPLDEGKGTKTEDHVANVVISLLDRAIAWNAKQPENLLLRGQVRIKQTGPDLDAVIKDAKDSLDLMPKLADAHGLLCEAYHLRSRTHDAVDDRIEDLNLSVASGKTAEKEIPETNPHLADYLLKLSCAYLEMANFSPDRSRENQQKDLGEAVRLAERAARLGKGNPEFPYLALGNAHEDMAWLADLDPEKNYLKAVAAFREAAANGVYSATAYCSIGRCYYRSLAESYQLVRFPGVRNADELMSECKTQLMKATPFSNPVEADLYLGLASLYQGKYEEADTFFGEAKSHAIDKALCDRVLYVAQWAEFPLVNQTLPEQQRYELATQRSMEVLSGGKLPATLLLDPAKEAAWIQGEIHRGRREPDKALALYDQFLPKDLAHANQTDVKLLRARIECNLGQLVSADTSSKRSIAEAIIRDADCWARLAVSRGARATAHTYAAMSRFRLYGEANDVKYLNGAIVNIRESVELTPQGLADPRWNNTPAGRERRERRVYACSILSARVYVKGTPLDQQQALVAESVAFDKDLDATNLKALKEAAIAFLVDKELANPTEQTKAARNKVLEWKKEREAANQPK